jgi:hypothetical protein
MDDEQEGYTGTNIGLNKMVEIVCQKAGVTSAEGKEIVNITIAAAYQRGWDDGRESVNFLTGTR